MVKAMYQEKRGEVRKSLSEILHPGDVQSNLDPEYRKNLDVSAPHLPEQRGGEQGCRTGAAGRSRGCSGGTVSIEQSDLFRP